MRGRLYDPSVGRFISPDPVVAEPGSALGWNPYVYVRNNPSRFVDPSGMACRPITGAYPGIILGNICPPEASTPPTAPPPSSQPGGPDAATAAQNLQSSLDASNRARDSYWAEQHNQRAMADAQAAHRDGDSSMTLPRRPTGQAEGLGHDSPSGRPNSGGGGVGGPPGTLGMGPVAAGPGVVVVCIATPACQVAVAAAGAAAAAALGIIAAPEMVKAVDKLIPRGGDTEGPVVLHYTSDGGFVGIATSRMIRPNVKNQVFFALESMGPRSAANRYFLGDRARGTHVFLLQLRPGTPVMPGPKIGEYVFYGTFRFERHVQSVLYAGPNPYPELSGN
jgi:hypothetical protein